MIWYFLTEDHRIRKTKKSNKVLSPPPSSEYFSQNIDPTLAKGLETFFLWPWGTPLPKTHTTKYKILEYVRNKKGSKMLFICPFYLHFMKTSTKVQRNP